MVNAKSRRYSSARASSGRRTARRKGTVFVLAALLLLTGAATAEAQTVPPAPGGLNSSIPVQWVSVVLLTWASGGDGGATITLWEMRRSTDGGTNWNPDWTPIPGSGAATTSYIVPGLSGGVTYTFQVRARNSVGPGAASPKTTITTRSRTPLAPFLMVTPGNGQVTLSYVSGGDGGLPILGWQYREARDGALDTEVWISIPGSAPGGAHAASITLGGVTNGTEYFYQVRAFNAVGNSAASAVASATPGALPGPCPRHRSR